MTVGKRRSFFALGVVVVLGGFAWVLLFPQTHDPYTFLKGRSVADVTVFGPGSWPASETRTYTWKEPWQDVVAKAGSDLAVAGLSINPDNGMPNSAVWTTELIDGGPCGTDAELVVSVHRGRLLPPDPKSDLTDENPQWVTVRVSQWLDENWITVVRYSLFSPDW